MSAFSEWRKRRAAREAQRAGDPWICPYCRALHPAFEVGGTRFAFGYPSVRFGCCGKAAFMLKDAKTGELLRFTRIGDGDADWMPKEAYFAWVEESNLARGHRPGSPHLDVVAKGVVKDVASLRPRPATEAAGDAPGPGQAPDPATPAAPAVPAAPLVFVAVAKADELKPGAGKVIQVHGKRIALFNAGGTFRAIDDRCAHAGQSLGVSPLEDGVVTCNGHGWRYDVVTGVCENRPDMGVRTYPVKVEDGAVLVGA